MVLVLVVGMTVVSLLSFALRNGPFRVLAPYGEDGRCVSCGRSDTHVHAVAGVREWLTLPRPKVPFRDFLPTTGLLFPQVLAFTFAWLLGVGEVADEGVTTVGFVSGVCVLVAATQVGLFLSRPVGRSPQV